MGYVQLFLHYSDNNILVDGKVDNSLLEKKYFKY